MHQLSWGYNGLREIIMSQEPVVFPSKHTGNWLGWCSKLYTGNVSGLKIKQYQTWHMFSNNDLIQQRIDFKDSFRGKVWGAL